MKNENGGKWMITKKKSIDQLVIVLGDAENATDFSDQRQYAMFFMKIKHK